MRLASPPFEMWVPSGSKSSAKDKDMGSVVVGSSVRVDVCRLVGELLGLLSFVGAIWPIGTSSWSGT